MIRQEFDHLEPHAADHAPVALQPVGGLREHHLDAAFRGVVLPQDICEAANGVAAGLGIARAIELEVASFAKRPDDGELLVVAVLARHRARILEGGPVERRGVRAVRVVCTMSAPTRTWARVHAPSVGMRVASGTSSLFALRKKFMACSSFVPSSSLSNRVVAVG